MPLVAQAQSGSVTIYGRLNGSVDWVKQGNATAGTTYDSRTRISSNLSRIGFKGTEDVGNGLKVIWQLENQANFENGNAAGTDGWVSRNSYLGLSSTWGSVIVGRFDLPNKDHSYANPFDTVSGLGDVGGLWGTTGGVLASTHSFQARRSNNLQYSTPTWGAFSGKIAYSAQNEALTAGSATGKIWSLSGTYDQGPLKVVLSHERQSEILFVGRKDSTTRLSGGYKFGNTLVTAYYERLNVEEATTDAKRNGLTIAAQHKIGNGELRGLYTKNGDLSGSAVAGSSSDTGAREYMIGYGYNLSKRTQLYTHYVKIDNKPTALYNFGTNATTPAAAGADPSGIVFGMYHNF
jgi:predicted porin